MRQFPPIAVLTGDIVGSTKATPDAVSQALSSVQSLVEYIATGTPSSTGAHFTRFRGDGWQCVVDDPHLAPRVAIAIMAKLRAAPSGLETRIAISIGSYTTLGSTNLSDANGDVFEKSGRALDNMPKHARIALHWDQATRTDTIALTLISERTSKWSQQQAEAMAQILSPHPPTLAIIAERLGISSQAVSYRLSGAGASAIRRAIDLWEDDLIERLTLNEDQPHA